MDVSHVRQRVQAIADAAPDYEVQHGLEDDLFIDTLREIINSSTDPRAQALAGAALESREIDFQRPCADHPGGMPPPGDLQGSGPYST